MQKFIISTILAFFITISIFSQQTSTLKSKTTKSFFEEQDANNWVYVLKDRSLASSSVFKMKNGVLQISGASSGYLRTQKTYSDYTLELEWRWTNKLGNSGVLVHIQAKDTIWPVCYQVQQRSDAAGDIICMNGLWAKECKDSVKFTVPKFLPSNEKALGEWNAMKVICMKNTLKVFINGVLQNNVTGLTAEKGFIGFQNEGIPLEFRKMLIY